jgi:prepilin-type N-terminal cleavage/methylation domain-containing protein
MIAGRVTISGRAARGAGVRAFSLLELLVVMGIIVILAAIAVPNVQAMTKDNNRVQAANVVRAMIGEARSIAISQHRQAGVVFFEETAAYARPLRTDATAMQLFVEDYNQAQYNPKDDNTVFIAYSKARTYLPAGFKVAALNDDVTRAVMTGNDDATGSRGVTRAILFDAMGNMITRHGLARPDVGTGRPGSYPRAYWDWNFTTKRGEAHMGISSPGIFIYDEMEYLRQRIPDGPAGDARRGPWIKQHADVVIVNGNTGGILE